MRKRGTLEPATVPRLRIRVVMTWQNTTQKCFTAFRYGARLVRQTADGLGGFRYVIALLDVNEKQPDGG